MTRQHITGVPTEEAKQRIRSWFYSPETPEFAWKELSWRKISEACQVSKSQAIRWLMPLIQKKYNVTVKQINDARYASAALQNVRGVKRPEKEVREIKEARKTKTIAEVADEYNISERTVQRISSKKSRDTKK